MLWVHDATKQRREQLGKRSFHLPCVNAALVEKSVNAARPTRLS
jgi:hypothetical protein